MTVLTSTGNVNLTSSTNWSPAQIPVDGDDLIIGAHTLTLDADRRLDSITFNNASSRLAISGTSRSVEATNGFILGASPSAQLIPTAIPTGTSLTLTGRWSGNFNINFGIASSTGGNLTLRTVGSSQSSVLFADVSGNLGRIITGSWTSGTLTTIGRFDLPSWTAAPTLVIMSGGTWSHQSIGLNSFGVGGHRIASMTGTATLNWTGSVDSQSNIANSGLFLLSSSSTSHTIGQTGDTFCLRNAVAVANQLTSIVYGTAGTVELVGVFSGRLDGLAIVGIGSTINWRNQSVVIPATDHCGIYMVAGTLNLSGLVVSNPTKFLLLDVGSATTTASAGTSITNTSTSATACAFGTTALDGRIVTLASDPPTLPAVQNVAAGTVYGYSASPLNGTGIINDPATIAAAVNTAMESLSVNALKRFVTVNTGETAAADGSVAKLAQGGAVSVDLTPVLEKLPLTGRAAKPGDEMGLTSSVLGQLFSDTDTAALVNAIIARVESDLDGADLSTAAIAVAVRNEILNRALSGNHETSGTVGKVLQFLDASISGRMAANALESTVTKVNSIDTLLTALTEVVSSVTRFKAAALSQAPSGGGGGAGDASQETLLEVQEAVDSIAVAIAGTAPVEPTGSNLRDQITDLHELLLPDDPDTPTPVITPGTGDITTGWLVCVDESGSPEADVLVYARLVDVPNSETGFAHSARAQEQTSAANGVVEFSLIKGASYYVWRGRANPPQTLDPVVVPANAGSTYELPSIRAI